MSLPVVRDFMDTVVETLRPDTDIMRAIDSLISNRITGAPVVDGDGGVVGMFTEKDCLNVLAHGDASAQRARGVVGDFMTKEVRSVRSDMNIYFVAGMFLNDHVRRFPVIDDGKLVGAVTRFDILRAIQKFYTATGR